MSRDSLPLHPVEVSTEWLTRALATRFPGAEVSQIRVMDETSGTTTRARLELGYRAGEGPRTVVVKLNGKLSHRLQLQALGGLFAEARLFATDPRLPLRTPDYIASFIDRRGLRSALVMADLAERGTRFHVATETLSADTVADGLRGLAALHGRYWALPTSNDLGWLRHWPAARVTAACVHPMTVGARLLRTDQAVAQVPVSGWSGRDTIRLWRRYARSLRSGTPTVLHGDAHVGNTYSVEGDTGFLDWQFVRHGSWEHDVGYFMIGALDTDERRRSERALLGEYLDALRIAGGDAPAWDEAWRRYRASVAYGLGVWVATVGLGDYQSNAISKVEAVRFQQARIDLETDAALG